MAPRDTAARVAAILNAGWMVRNYTLQRTLHDRQRRAQAIQHMGLVVRDAFAHSEDFEPLLGAVADGLRPRDERQF